MWGSDVRWLQAKQPQTNFYSHVASSVGDWGQWCCKEQTGMEEWGGDTHRFNTELRKQQTPKDGLCVWLGKKGLLNSQWYFDYIHTYRGWIICEQPSLKTERKTFSGRQVQQCHPDYWYYLGIKAEWWGSTLPLLSGEVFISWLERPFLPTPQRLALCTGAHCRYCHHVSQYVKYWLF